MVKTYCDCCKKEITSGGLKYSIQINEDQYVRLRYPDVCPDCFNRINDAINSISTSDDVNDALELNTITDSSAKKWR